MKLCSINVVIQKSHGHRVLAEGSLKQLIMKLWEG